MKSNQWRKIKMTTEDLCRMSKTNYDAERYITLYQNNARDVLSLIDGTLKLTNHAWFETLDIKPVSIYKEALSGQDGLVDTMEFIASHAFANGIKEIDYVLTNEGIKHFFIVPADYCGRPDTVDILLTEGDYEMYIGCSMYPGSEEMGYSTNTLIDVEQCLCLSYLKEPTQSWKQIAEFWAEAFKELMNMKPPLDPLMTEEHVIDVEDLSRFHINDRNGDDIYPLYVYSEDGSIIVNPVLTKFMDNHMKFRIEIGMGEKSYSMAKFDSREMKVHVSGRVITVRRNDDIEIEIRPSDLSHYRYIKIEVIK
jgi:hypothetical protein